MFSFLFPQCFLLNQVLYPYLSIYLTSYLCLLLNWKSPKLSIWGKELSCLYGQCSWLSHCTNYAVWSLIYTGHFSWNIVVKSNLKIAFILGSFLELKCLFGLFWAVRVKVGLICRFSCFLCINFQIELASGKFPYAASPTPFEQLKQVVKDPPPKLPAGKYSPEFEDFISLWYVVSSYLFEQT